MDEQLNGAVSDKDMVWEFGDTDLGFEGVTDKCVKRSFLKVAQFGAAEVKKQDPLYIPGLEPGMFYCPQTRNVYGETFLAVAIKFWQAYAVYDGEGTDSQFKGNMAPAEFDSKVLPVSHRSGSYTLDNNGYRYVDTRNFLVIPYDKPLNIPMLFSMYSTAIPASRSWLTQAEALTVKVSKDGKIIEAPVPLRGGVWKLKATYQSSKKGDYFEMDAPEYMGLINPDTPVGAISMRERVNSLYKESRTMDTLRMSGSDDILSIEDHTSEAPSAPRNEGKERANVTSAFSGKSAAIAANESKKEQDIF